MTYLLTRVYIVFAYVKEVMFSCFGLSVCQQDYTEVADYKSVQAQFFSARPSPTGPGPCLVGPGSALTGFQFLGPGLALPIFSLSLQGVVLE